MAFCCLHAWGAVSTAHARARTGTPGCRSRGPVCRQSVVSWTARKYDESSVLFFAQRAGPVRTSRSRGSCRTVASAAQQPPSAPAEACMAAFSVEVTDMSGHAGAVGIDSEGSENKTCIPSVISSAAAAGSSNVRHTEGAPPHLSARTVVVLDTNVVLDDYACVYAFGSSDVCIPLTVIEELDKFKEGNEESNYNARSFLRFLDEVSRSAVELEALRTTGLPLGPGDDFATGDCSGEDQACGRLLLTHGSRNGAIERAFFYDSPDNRILSAVAELAERRTHDRIILVTRDVNLRMKARALGFEADDHEPAMSGTTGQGQRYRDADDDDVYSGVRLIEHVSSEAISGFFASTTPSSSSTDFCNSKNNKDSNQADTAPLASGKQHGSGGKKKESSAAGTRADDFARSDRSVSEYAPSPASVSSSMPSSVAEEVLRPFFAQRKQPKPNEFFVLRNCTSSVLATYAFDESRARFAFGRVQRRTVYGITPRNAEQVFALDALLNPKLPLVALSGRAGTGKTLLAIAAALEQLIEGTGQNQQRYEQVLVTRPAVPLSGRDSGFLPGDINSKLEPFVQPLFDNVAVIRAANSQRNYQGKLVENARALAIAQMLEQDKIKIAPLSYIRGRSLHRSLLIVDEAQNLSPREVLCICTRAGDGTKIVFMGDIQQTDLVSRKNGLAHLIERMSGQRIFAHLDLKQCERSELASIASELL
ncbi:protein YlaK [Porphyridium purpureum]|uniref:Protein YlaK n=1 Tax=Porphyridium purpureum TaxID=35688 RepID=A0A5J4YQK1_PORPP|nr:protein YlaK [Porphyridium purpureum]|eukprot:POR3002..scf222_8